VNANTSAIERRKHPGLTSRQREEIIAYLLISPWIIGFLMFTLGPMVASLGLSFFETNLFSSRFVGLKNYATLISLDETKSLFWKSLYNTAYYAVLSIPLTIGAGFLIALLLNQNIRGQSAYRVLYYLPAVIPNVAASMIWLYLPARIRYCQLASFALPHRRHPVAARSEDRQACACHHERVGGRRQHACIPGRSTGDPHRAVRGGYHRWRRPLETFHACHVAHDQPHTFLCLGNEHYQFVSGF